MRGKVALVTGASQGIGKGIALVLAEAGYDIALHCSSNQEAACATCGEIEAMGRRCAVIQTDLSQHQGIEELFAQFDRAFDHIDLLVNNAGITLSGSLLTMSPEEFDQLNGIDWRGGFFCTQMAARRMIRDGITGSIVLLTSNQSEMVFSQSALYGPVKAALKKFCKHAALELSPYGIRVNAIAPGYTDTGNPRMGKQERTYNAIPAARWVTPREIGQLVLNLTMPAMASLTGQEIVIDGGAQLLCGAGGMSGLREFAREMQKELQGNQ